MSQRAFPKPAAAAPDNRMAARLANVVIAGIALYLILDIVAQLLPPHYSPIHQAESDLAVGPYGYIMTINFVVRGVLSSALLYALALELPPAAKSRFGSICLGIWAAGALGLALFPTDVSSTRHTVHGMVHLLIALIAFASIALAELLLSRRLNATPWPGTARKVIKLLGYWTACTLVLLALSESRPRTGGLFERLFLCSALLWILVVALQISFGTTALPRS